MSDAVSVRLFSGPRIRLVRQTEIAECGLACLAMIAGYHGADGSIASLRGRFGLSARGANLRTLISLADSLGFIARPVQLTARALPKLHLPAILHWDDNHFVVAEKTKKSFLSTRERILIHDPSGLSQWLTLDEASHRFTGVALELRPVERFGAAPAKERLKLRQLWQRATGLKRALSQVLIFSLLMQAFVLVSPYLLQISVDRVLPAMDLSLLAVLAIGFALFATLNAVASFLRSLVLLSAGASFSFGITSNLARHLFRLPVSWFERRHVGDVLSRFQSVLPIQNAITKDAVTAFLDGSLAVLTLAMMFYYSSLLAVVAVGTFILYCGIRAFSFAIQRRRQQDQIIATAKEQSILIETLRGMVTLRLLNGEPDRHAQWQDRLATAVNSNIAVSKIDIWQSSAQTLLFSLELIVSVWISIASVIHGGFSVGMMFAYLAYKDQFMTRGASLVSQMIAFRMLGLHLERLSDIALTEQDVGFQSNAPRSDSVKGRLELRNVCYRYCSGDPPVLTDVSLVVEGGAHVAITGPSGGGKSTLIKIILGLLEPDSGQVLVDDIDLKKFGHRNFRDHVGAVLQEDHLFAGSIADNITLFSRDPDKDRVLSAAAAACIDEEIRAMPMGFDSLVGDMGSALSGGQKQRILLARALYRKPRFLIMDEGTSHLDAELECKINSAIASMGITRIVVAHRLETLQCANSTFFLDANGMRQCSSREFDLVRHQKSL